MPVLTPAQGRGGRAKRDPKEKEPSTIVRCPHCGHERADPAPAGGASDRCPACGVASLDPESPATLVGDASGIGLDQLTTESALPAPGHPAPPAPPAASAAPAASGPVPSGVLGAAPALEGIPFGRYRLLEVLGRGGMGVVYRALDPQLQRAVALKTLHPEAAPSPEEVGRFLREARAAGGLRHPNIVQVHDVGTWDGRHYFTMDFIPGENLEQARRHLPLRRFLEILHDVAGALHAAHEAGIIHRDVKPGNVILDAAGHPYVTDFGLAKVVHEGAGAARLTATGEVFGTPGFMAPEQATGRVAEIGPWTDVWSLGVILYDQLAGTPPFAAPTALALVAQIIGSDPPPPSRAAAGRPAGAARVHSDLDTICLKALEKDPARRYRSAAELAEELRRFLAGEPIAAHPPSAAYRAARWVGRRRWGVTTAAAVLCLGALAGFLAWRVGEERRRAERSVLESRLVQDLRVPVAEALGARRGGEVELLQRVAADALRRADALLARDPDVAEAHYVKGWLLRLTGRTGPAVAELDRALALRPEDPAALYERGLALAAGCRDLVAEARRAWEQAERAARGLAPSAPLGREPAAAELERLRPALADLRTRAAADFARMATAADARGTGPEAAGSPRLACGRGLLALYRGDLDGAAAAIEAALAQDRFLDEAQLARIDLVRARVARGAAPQDRLLDAYDGALQVNRGLPDLWRGRGEARHRQALDLAAAGHLEAAFDAWGRADEDLRAALRLAPADADLGVLRAEVSAAWAAAESSRGTDSRARLRETVALATRTIEADPAHLEAYKARAYARLQLGQQMRVHGEDPQPPYREALSDYDEVLRRDPEDVDARINRCLVRTELADARGLAAQGARDDLRCAIADAEEALRRDPGAVVAFANRGSARRCLGTAEGLAGRDPRASFREAIADYDQALRRAPELAALYNNRANLRVMLGEAEAERGADPRESYRGAVADSGEALKRNPELAQSYYVRACAAFRRGEYEAGRGLDAREAFRSAVADYDQALRRNPEYPEAWQFRGNARYRLAAAEEEHGSDGRAGFRDAIADYAEAIRRGYDLARTHYNRGHAGLALAQVEARRGGDRRAPLQQAIEDFGRASALDPANAAACANRGAARLLLAEAVTAAGADPCPLYEQAVADYGAALARAPAAGDALNNRAMAWLHWGEAEAARGLDPRARYEAALADVQAAIAHGFAPARLSQGEVLRALGRYDEAIAAFEAGAQSVPGAAEWARAEIEKTRVRMGKKQ